MPTELLNKASNTSEDILLSDSLLENEYIEHHGTKGQKWGVRRYQNSDGSLTEEGRRRYGVGPALGSVKKAAGKAIRKAIGRQTDEELDAELSKAAHKRERKDKKELIDELSGKHKRLHQMTDRELDDFINRKNKEIKARQLEKALKEENRGEIEKFLRDAAKGVASDVVSGVGGGIGSGLRKSIETSLSAKAARKQEAKDAYAAQKLAKKLEGRRDRYETEEQRLAREADNAKRRKDIERDNTEAKAFRGDIDAQNMMNRSQNKWKADEEDSQYKKAAKNAEDKRRLAEEQLRERALSGDKKAAKDLRNYQEASSGRRSQKESKSEKKIRKAEQAAKLADARARETEAETRQKTLEGDQDAKKRYTGWSDAKKGTPKPKNGDGKSGDKPKGTTPKEETPKDKPPKDKPPKDETPKDIVPKDETPKDEAPKKKKNNGSAKHSDFSNIDIESEYVGSLVVDGFISYHSDISFD